MSDSKPETTPKTQGVPAGGPPLPPRNTALGFDDDDSEQPKGLSAAERAQLIEYLRQVAETPSGATK